MELTDAQKEILTKAWNKDPNHPPSLKELTNLVFGGDFDGRSNEGKAIKKALAACNLRAKTTGDRTGVRIELTDAQKTYVTNNVHSMNSLEMAKILFANTSLTPFHPECRAIHKYIEEELNNETVYQPNEFGDVPDENYQGPRTIEEGALLVNKYLNLNLNINNLSPTMKKNMFTMVNNMKVYRYVAQMTSYISLNERNLCEDAFVRYIYDKPDLTQEELDQYIVLCNEIVQQFKIQRRSELLQRSLEEISRANNENGDESMRISMSLVEAIGKASTEYNQCITRQGKLLDDLKVKRSTRMADEIKENASILNLVQLWKQEESRLELMAHAEKEQKLVAQEVDKLSSMAAIKAKIMGLTKEEATLG